MLRLTVASPATMPRGEGPPATMPILSPLGRIAPQWHATTESCDSASLRTARTRLPDVRAQA